MLVGAGAHPIADNLSNSGCCCTLMRLPLPTCSAFVTTGHQSLKQALNLNLYFAPQHTPTPYRAMVLRRVNYSGDDTRIVSDMLSMQVYALARVCVCVRLRVRACLHVC